MTSRQLGFAILLAAGLAGAAGTAHAAPPAGTLVVAEWTGPNAGWAMETDDSFILTRAGAAETLTRIDFDATLRPGLATAWTQTTPTTWDVTLRPGVTFQDGQKMTAEAVVGSLRSVLAAPTPARSFSKKLITAVDVVDPATIRVTTAVPMVLLPYRLSSPNTAILSPAAYPAGPGGKVNPVRAGTGPFTITEVIPQQALKLVRNDAYWDTKAAIARVEIRFIPDGEVRATQVKSGEAQIATVIPVSTMKSTSATPGVTVLATDLPRVTSLYLNNQKAPLNDIRVRQAIQSAIDIDGIIAGVYEGSGQPAMGPFAPNEPWFPKGAAPARHDVARAKALLAEAGIAPGTLKLGLFAYSERAEFADLAAVIQDELKQVGIQVDIRSADYAALEPDMLSGNFDMTLLSRGHLVDVADPGAFLTSDYTCSGSYNISHFCDKAVDALVDQATVALDAAQRHALYGQVARLLQDQAVDVFILREQQRDALTRVVGGYRIHPMDQYGVTAALTLAP